MENHIPQVAMYLAGIVLMILGSGYLLKRLNRSGFQQNGPLQIVASLSMGLKEKLVLVQIGENQQILIGVTPDRIVKLESFASLVEMNPGSEQENESTDSGLSTGSGLSEFKDKLQQFMQPENR